LTCGAGVDTAAAVGAGVDTGAGVLLTTTVRGDGGGALRATSLAFRALARFFHTFVQWRMRAINLRVFRRVSPAFWRAFRLAALVACLTALSIAACCWATDGAGLPLDCGADDFCGSALAVAVALGPGLAACWELSVSSLLESTCHSPIKAATKAIPLTIRLRNCDLAIKTAKPTRTAMPTTMRRMVANVFILTPATKVPGCRRTSYGRSVHQRHRTPLLDGSGCGYRCRSSSALRGLRN
jgi:hypothetical protein